MSIGGCSRRASGRQVRPDVRYPLCGEHNRPVAPTGPIRPPHLTQTRRGRRDGLRPSLGSPRPVAAGRARSRSRARGVARRADPHRQPSSQTDARRRARNLHGRPRSVPARAEPRRNTSNATPAKPPTHARSPADRLQRDEGAEGAERTALSHPFQPHAKLRSRRSISKHWQTFDWCISRKIRVTFRFPGDRCLPDLILYASKRLQNRGAVDCRFPIDRQLCPGRRARTLDRIPAFPGDDRI